MNIHLSLCLVYRFVNAIKVESFHLSFLYLEGHKINLNTQRVPAMYILKIRVKRTCRWFVTGVLHLHRKEHDSLWQAHFIAYDFTLWKVCANLLEEYFSYRSAKWAGSWKDSSLINESFVIICHRLTLMSFQNCITFSLEWIYVRFVINTYEEAIGVSICGLMPDLWTTRQTVL